MPQMAPIFWTCLFLLFTSMMVLSIVKMSFSSTVSAASESKEQTKSDQTLKNLSWKW